MPRPNARRAGIMASAPHPTPHTRLPRRTPRSGVYLLLVAVKDQEAAAQHDEEAGPRPSDRLLLVAARLGLFSERAGAQNHGVGQQRRLDRRCAAKPYASGPGVIKTTPVRVTRLFRDAAYGDPSWR